ncbi:Protein FAM228B [Liparis tanakae]|uniref:Protein FAM228B n=1 Tax=Liparis tanakae TaxID=230148 RepID=A0A4Z2H8M8_9TELE|nr:Protein FAM228B [Liparis tanakae]
MEADRQQLEEITQPLLDTQSGLLKDVERFLRHRDVTELRRRELLHKRWTERVWFPLQRRLEEHVSSCGPAAAKRRQSLHGHYLHHCNTKVMKISPFRLRGTQDVDTQGHKLRRYLRGSLLRVNLRRLRPTSCDWLHLIIQSLHPEALQWGMRLKEGGLAGTNIQ